MAVTRNMNLVPALMGIAPMESSDASLAERLARGEEGAFEELVALHGARIGRLAHRLLGWSGDTDDVVQEVFLSVLKQIGTFRHEAKLGTWLTTITINKCRSHRRSWLARLRGMMRHRRDALAADAKAAADAGLAADEVGVSVRRAINELRPRDHEVIVLFYLEQLPLEQIAGLLEISRNAVEVRLHRARQRLRAKLAGLIEE
jgi:RNA polymerase sigma-70 factor (ECF subfamily)